MIPPICHSCLQKIFKGTALFFACLASVSSSRAETEAQTSVLCFWEMLVSVSAIGKVCAYDQGTEMSRALEDAITQLDQFILLHSDLPNTRELLEEKKQEILAQQQEGVRENGEFCNPSSEISSIGLHQHFADQNPPAKLRADIGEELAKPRKPPFAGTCI
jgi:hypothetical protein